MGDEIIASAHLQKLIALGTITVPFGKYVGRNLFQIPLSYMDDTISVMPEKWLVRRVQEFVDSSMDWISVQFLKGEQLTYVPKVTLEDIYVCHVRGGDVMPLLGLPKFYEPWGDRYEN